MALVMATPYQATEGLLELLFEELLQADTYERLYQDTNSLRNYLVGTPEINQTLTEVVSRLVSVTKKAKEVKGNIDSNQALKEAYSQFKTEMLHVLGPLLLRSPAAKVAGVGLLAAGTVAVVPALAVGALGVVGFSSAGPVAGSLAAAIQSIFYGGAVASGSAFALCQGAAMGGIVVGSVVEITAGVAALGGAARLLHGPQP